MIFLPPEHKTFEELRSAALKSTAPGPIHEVENLIASLNEVGVDRDAAVARLSSLFSTSPDVAIDLTGRSAPACSYDRCSSARSQQQ